MGPYCKFCDRRCFVPVTEKWPKHIKEAYGRFGLAATCRAGQRLEKERLGYSWDDVEQTWSALDAASSILTELGSEPCTNSSG